MILLILMILLLTLLLGLLSPSLLLPNWRAGKVNGGWSHLARVFICQSRFLWSELFFCRRGKGYRWDPREINRFISVDLAIDVMGLADSLCSRCHSLPTEQHRNMTSGKTLETLIIITRTPWSPHPTGWQFTALLTPPAPAPQLRGLPATTPAAKTRLDNPVILDEF